MYPRKYHTKIKKKLKEAQAAERGEARMSGHVRATYRTPPAAVVWPFAGHLTSNSPGDKR
jgi:hypothetical protein